MHITSSPFRRQQCNTVDANCRKTPTKKKKESVRPGYSLSTFDSTCCVTGPRYIQALDRHTAYGKEEKMVAPAPSVAKKVVFGIGQDIQPKRDLLSFVKWPRYIRPERFILYVNRSPCSPAGHPAVTLQSSRSPSSHPAVQQVTLQSSRSPCSHPAVQQVTLQSPCSPAGHPAVQQVSLQSACSPAGHPAVTLQSSRSPSSHPAVQQVTQQSPCSPAGHPAVTLQSSRSPCGHPAVQQVTLRSPCSPAGHPEVQLVTQALDRQTV
ncbi:hypothetical protein NQZ68_040795 [Dissostichus eleginoides]|nr:hypothetical protein NQZ68_040795 [Dissostichus eleginoides]